MSRSVRAAGLAVLLLGPPLRAQSLDWLTRATFYGDNTEFFTPYRTGETILGAQFTSELRFRTGRRTEFLAGVFGDHRSGDDEFLPTVKPILRFRYHTGTSTGILGTMIPERRHGLLEPLEQSTLELTRPIEYGGSWTERRRYWDGEIFLNWQKLNRPEQREVFDFGWVLRVRPIRQLSLEHQLHGLHHGGQLFDAGVPVTNNTASGFGVVVADSLPVTGRSSLAVYRLSSSGNIDPDAPAGRPTHGNGWYVRAAITPRNWFELFSISWWGRDFLSQEGDNNYNSVGSDTAFYRSRRKYWELGILRRTRIENRVELDAELRFHRIDYLKSIALGHSRWEYSYRLVVRAPFELTLSR